MLFALAFLFVWSAAEGRDLVYLVVRIDVGEAETAPDNMAPAASKDLPNLLGGRTRRNVIVLRLPSKQKVADSAADDIRLVTRSYEFLDYADGRRIQRLAKLLQDGLWN